jgi:hypothetical protein
MFLASDPAFHLASRANANVIINTVAELDQLSNQKLQALFPAKMINGKATLRLFAASSMTINQLKKAPTAFTTTPLLISGYQTMSLNPQIFVNLDLCLEKTHKEWTEIILPANFT